jgi:hypothetical protein
VAQLVFKTSAAVQPTARSVRLRRRSVKPKASPLSLLYDLSGHFIDAASIGTRAAIASHKIVAFEVGLLLFDYVPSQVGSIQVSVDPCGFVDPCRAVVG